MQPARSMEATRTGAKDIPGYNYGSPEIAKSPITMEEFALLKQSAQFTEDDERWLRIAGEVLGDQVEALVGKWREVIASLPHLAKYSLNPKGERDEKYSQQSGMRFQQWVLDTCLRPYDQDWLNYQQEMALRHTSLKKNKTDKVDAVPKIHLRHIIAFSAVVTDPKIIKPFLAAKGHNPSDIENMRAWSKSLWLQIALWTEPYTNMKEAPNEW